MLEQYDDMLALYGTHTGVNFARKHIGWYTKGLHGSAEFRNKVNQQADPQVVVAMLREFYAPWLLAGGRLKKRQIRFSKCVFRATAVLGRPSWTRLLPNRT